MPSMISLLVRSQIGLLNPLLHAMDLAKTRKLQDVLGKMETRALEASVGYRPISLKRFEGAWAFPLDGRVRRAILYLHGGAYTAGSLHYAMGFGGMLAQATGRATFCAAYRCAPEEPYPAALEDALTAYRLMLQRYAPEDIALSGESAGGGLCFSLALKLKGEGLPLPGQIVTLSPWLDLTMSAAPGDLEGKDILLSREGLLKNARLYAAGHPLDDPFLSPLFGDLRGLPPSIIFVGTREILLRDAERMHSKLLMSGCRSELVCKKGMWHAYVLYRVPEAKSALKKIAKRLEENRP